LFGDQIIENNKRMICRRCGGKELPTWFWWVTWQEEKPWKK